MTILKIALGLVCIALIVTIAITETPAHSAEILTLKRLPFPTQPVDLHVIYNYEGYVQHPSTQAPVIEWSLRFGSQISESQLAALPASVSWNLRNTQNGKMLLPQWRAVAKTSLRDARGEDFRIAHSRALIELIPNLKSYDLVFSASENSPVLFVLPLSSFCGSHASSFRDLTAGKLGCDVSAAKLPNAQAECATYGATLLDYVKHEILECHKAKGLLFGAGCDSRLACS